MRRRVGGSTGKEGAMAEEIKQRQRGAGENECRQTAERHVQMEGEIGEGGSKGEESGRGGGAKQGYKSWRGVAVKSQRRREEERSTE